MTDKKRFYINESSYTVWCGDCFSSSDPSEPFIYAYIASPEDRLTCSVCATVIKIGEL